MSQPPSTKRQKLYRSCDSCVSAKAKCEEVEEGGCRRCRVKERLCSLAAAGIIMPSSSSVPAGASSFSRQTSMTGDSLLSEVDQLRETITRLTNRLDRLESADLLAYPAHFAATTISSQASPSVPYVSAKRTLRIDLLNPGTWQRFNFDERGICSADDSAYPDVIAAGICTREQADMYFHLFKHRFAAISPLPTLLSISTARPTHPFVLLATLAHMTFHLPPEGLPAFWRMLDDCISLVMSSAINHDVILALYILSLAPLPVSSTDSTYAPVAPFSPARVISLAYQVGSAFGMDAMSRWGARFPDLSGPEWEEKLARIVLWEAVKNRYNLIHLNQTRSDSLALSYISALPSHHPSPHFRAAIAHLSASSSLVDCFVDTTKAISDAEEDWMHAGVDMVQVIQTWQRDVQKAHFWRGREAAQFPFLLFELDTILYTVALRLTSLVIAVPSPVNREQRSHGLRLPVAALLSNSAALMKTHANPSMGVDLDPYHVPAYLYTSYLGAVITARRAVDHRTPNRPTEGPDVIPSAAQVTAAETRICLAGGIGKWMIESYRKASPHSSLQENHQPGVQHGDGMMWLDPTWTWEGWFDFGTVGTNAENALSAWDSLLGQDVARDVTAI